MLAWYSSGGCDSCDGYPSLDNSGESDGKVDGGGGCNCAKTCDVNAAES